MKVEIEYTVRRKTVVECDMIDDVLNALLKTEWTTEGRLLERKPTITSKLVLDDNIATYNKSDGFHYFKPEILETVLPEKITSISAWFEILKERTANIMKENPTFSYEKAKYMAKQDMPALPGDGWGR